MRYINLFNDRMSAGSLFPRKEAMFKSFYVISTEGSVVNKSKEQDIGTGKR